MKIAYISDLHTEFYDNKYSNVTIDSLPDLDPADILVIAGDFGYFQHGEYNKAGKDYLKKLSPKYKYILIVPGNHEYYRGSYQGIPRGVNKVNDIENAFVINDDKFEVDNVSIYFTTLFSNLKMGDPVWRLNDFNYIRYNFQLLTASQMNGIHKENVMLLKDFIENPSDKTKIVVTHFPPVHEIKDIQDIKYDGSLDSYFYNNVLDEIESFDSVRYWIYGHNHLNPSKELRINGCEFICNQYGYRNENTKRENMNQFIEV